MKVELRRRVHENHINFHYELILIPDETESEIIDEFMRPNNANDYPFPVFGRIQTADNFSLYIALQEDTDIQFPPPK